jgi:competence ComEA-like helix-hairpin-helix protein
VSAPPRQVYDVQLSRRALGVLLALCAAGGALLAALAPGRRWLGAAPGVDAARVAAAAERINPNTATAASLRRLPGVGAVRAGAIVAFRRRHGPRAFTEPNDLMAVKGIGSGIAERVAPYLRFTDRRP